MRQVSIVEDSIELQKTNIGKSINVEKRRKDFINSSGNWETLIQYGDYTKEIILGYLVIKKGESKVPLDYSFVSEVNVKEDALPNENIYQKIMRQHTYTSVLLESAEMIAKEEHGSRKIAADYEPSSSVMFKRLGYEQECNLMTKELNTIEHICFLSTYNCIDLMFDENKNIIENPVDADAAEKEWLKNYDEEYRIHKASSL